VVVPFLTPRLPVVVLPKAVECCISYPSRCAISFFPRRCLSIPNRKRMARQPTETDPLLDDDHDAPRTSPNTTTTTTTTGATILALAIPAAAALLIDPLMTLVDTAFVGRFSANADALAGMGSAAPILTFSFYLFNFLGTATTPLVATKRAIGGAAGCGGEPNNSTTSTTTSNKEAMAVGGQALSLALILGVLLALLLLATRQSLLTVMGTGITGDAAINDYALTFLSVRALAAPAVLSIQASIGVLRGYLDTKTPVVVLILANILNFGLDVVLIAFAGWGPLGAAIATTTAEWISAGLLLAVLAGRLPSASGELGSNRRNELGDTVAVVPLLSMPSWQEVRLLVVASSFIFFRTFILQLSLMGAAVMAARGGEGMEVGVAAAVAAHQIAIQLWLLCRFFCDSLAAASQGLVADALGRKDSERVRDISQTVLAYGFSLGVILSLLLQVGNSSGFLVGFFTRDPGVRSALDEILPLIILAQPLNALVFAADGVLQGASEFPFQAKSMALSGLTGVSTFLALEVGMPDVDALVHVWSALVALQVIRGLTSWWKLVERDGSINLLASK
jgi:putative MATE family efflux protein